MLNEVVKLRNDRDNVTLTSYAVVDEVDQKPRRAVLICPGGGYSYIADPEGERIALKYLAYGINAFVLNYSVKDNTSDFKYPMPLVEASNAMKYIKDNAERYNIDPDKVFVCGFSAGGHLASMLGTIWHRDEVYAEAEEMEYGYNRPAGMILCYPVIHAKGHFRSIRNLTGKENPTEGELNYLASHLNVDERTCPAFIWHVIDDACVDVESVLDMGIALKRSEIKYEMHLYPYGGHGLGCPDFEVSGRVYYRNIEEWMKLSVDFIKSI